jgi:hypothetical protein
VRFIESNDANFLSMYGLQFRQKKGTAEYVSGGTIIANGTRSGFSQADAFDQDNNTRWALDSLTTLPNAFLGYHYAAPITVEQVSMYAPPTETPKKFVVEYSDDGVSWSIGLTVADQTDWSNPAKDFDLPVATSGTAPTQPVAATRWNFVPPLAADFTDVTTVASGGTLGMADDTDEGLLISLAPSTGDKTSFALKDLPAAGDWTVTLRIQQNNLFLDFGMQGICWTNGVRAGLFGPEVSRSFVSNVMYQIGGGYLSTPIARPTGQPMEWLRLSYTAATATYSFQVSNNGKVFVPVGYATDTDVGGKLTKIGVGFGCNQAPIVTDYKFTATIPYWSQSF